VFSGPTNQPQLYDPKYKIPIHEKQQKKRQLTDGMNAVKSNYKKNVTERSDNDRLHRYRENLWIWFLSEPKKVCLAIKDVQKEAAQSGSASYRALNMSIAPNESKLNK